MTTQTTRIVPEREPSLAAEQQPRVMRVGTMLLDRYEVLAVLGSSQLGEVWQCFDRHESRHVAIRWLPTDLQRSKRLLNAIHEGIRRLSDKTHDNIAVIRRLMHVGEQTYVVGDYAPGMDIGMWSRAGTDGRRTLTEALPILGQIAAGLDFVHQQRVVHGNLKPSNVFLGPDGVVRITDFGLTPRGHLVFVRGEIQRTGSTGAYLAPEIRTADDEPDAGSDQYALAVLACEMLGGPELNPTKLVPGDLPATARAALARALSRKPRNRFASCDDFVRALGGERIARRRGRSAAEWQRIKNHLILSASTVAMAAVLGVIGYITVEVMKRPKPEPAPIKLSAPAPLPAKKAEPAGPTVPRVPPLVITTEMPTPGQPWATQTGNMEFVWVPGLSMWVGRFEVTNDQYKLKDPEHDSGDFRELPLTGPRQPVVRINFEDCVEYAAWLTEQEQAAGKLPEGWRYRLPSRTEAIAYTRAGMAGAYPWGDGWPPRRGNYGDETLAATFRDLQYVAEYTDGFAVTAPVEASGENAMGLFGAGGNVWETTSKVPGGKEFGGWQGGGGDDHLPSRMGCEVTYGFLGNARGAVNGLRLVLAPIADEAPPPPAAQAPATAAVTPTSG